jgi:hypothetical protein
VMLAGGHGQTTGKRYGVMAVNPHTSDAVHGECAQGSGAS